jgi:hypothetical protein
METVFVSSDSNEEDFTGFTEKGVCSKKDNFLYISRHYSLMYI